VSVSVSVSVSVCLGGCHLWRRVHTGFIKSTYHPIPMQKYNVRVNRVDIIKLDIIWMLRKFFHVSLILFPIPDCCRFWIIKLMGDKIGVKTTPINVIKNTNVDIWFLCSDTLRLLFCGSDSVFSKDALLSHIRERKRTGIPLNPWLVGRRVVSASRWTSETHRVTSETLQRHCARSSVTNVLSLEKNSPQPTSLSILLAIHEINFEENWRYRTLSKLETLI